MRPCVLYTLSIVRQFQSLRYKPHEGGRRRTIPRYGGAALTRFTFTILVASLCSAVILISLALPAVAAPSSSQTMSVTCTIANALEASFPANIDLGELSPSSTFFESPEGIITVWSNAPWGIKIKSDNADGRLMEWNGTNYVSPGGKTLGHPLEWKGPTGDYAPLTGTEASVVAGQAPTPDAGQSIAIRFRQRVTYSDAPLSAAGNKYRIAVILTASQGY
ncbi:MAG TPA: hypothetical protein GXX51_11730 [Firmicutes bacterium]|nr:hypothetical protein [Bacillota bacterium]